MAPRKGKVQGKRTSIKIKSKLHTQDSETEAMMKMKPEDKTHETIKWLKPMTADGAINRCEVIPDWFNGSFYNKHGAPSTSTVDNNNTYSSRFRPDTHEDKSSSSDVSDECDCSPSNYPDQTCGILKRKSSSTSSLVAHYIKSGMDHVASFIVESAIRFGRQHGVVVPDKNTPNLYEITPPDRSRKIRFKIPDNEIQSSKKERRRSHWKSKGSGSWKSPSPFRKRHKSNPSTGSNTDSLEDIIPLLKKLEEDGGGIVTSDLDLDKLAGTSETEIHDRKSHKTRDKFRSMEKRYKSVGDVLEQEHSTRKYSSPSKNHWKRFKRDSLELGRQRLRGSPCTRKDESASPSIY